jgi:hypothetical protein
MNSSPQNISAMTDISANIFSVLILILIILLAARNHADFPGVETPPEISPKISIETELAGIERTPLSSDELFDLLYERSEKTGSIKIDLFGETIDIVANGKTEHFSSIENAISRLKLLATASNHSPLGIYVFSIRFYRVFREPLKALGGGWREVSVPQALRASRSAGSWSAGFSELVAGPADRARFRVELARLLESSPTHDPSNVGGGGAATTSSQSPETIAPETIVQTFWRWLRAVLRAVFILIGFAFVMWVELRHRRKSLAGRAGSYTANGGK